MEIKIGSEKEVSDIVTKEKTALFAGSGGLEVYATPFMAALMERAAFELLNDFLEDGLGSVGISLDISHLSATPVGLSVKASAKITAVSGRTVTFSVKAYDNSGEIGAGEHKRCVIDNDKFLSKAAKKLNKE